MRWIRKIIKANPEELKKAGLLFVYFFLAISSYYTLKPVRSSLFLSAFGPEKLPWVYLGTAAVTFVAVLAYAELAKRVNRDVLVGSTTLFFIVNLVIFWWLFKFHPGGRLPFVFYIWVSNYNVILVTQFWSVANDIYNPREGKRLYGFIGSGGILGSIVTGFLVTFLVRRIGTENLLLVSAGFLMILLLIAKKICSLDSQERKERETKLPEVDQLPETGRNGFSLIWKSPYLKLITAIVIFLTIVATIVDYQFQSVIARRFSKDEMTAFLGTFFSFLTLAAFLVQFFLTSRIHQRLGIAFSLLILPAVSIIGGLTFLAAPVFLIGAALKFLDGSIGYSIQQASKELLYLPTPREVKYRAKTFIDVFFYRFGDALASILILIFSAYQFSLRSLSGLVVGLAILWAGIILLTRRHYIASLREIIKCRGSYDCPEGPPGCEAAFARLVPELHREAFPDKEAVRREIVDEARNYFLCLAVSQQLERQERPEIRPLHEKLQEKRFKIAKRIFRLISFVQPAEDLYRAFNYLVLKQREHDAIALELLDNIMLHRVRKKVLPFFNPELTDEERFATGCRYWGITPEDLKSYLLTAAEEYSFSDPEALAALELRVPCHS
ncbi:MAG: MFS transporter [Deltaproteobacteria bacterium]|nr:MFS transporter [Deltaproteobacteria bacterium]